jgi:integrase/recombinase XerC
MKRLPKPELSEYAEATLGGYEGHLRQEVDLSLASVRNYLSDLRHFMAWYEQIWSAGREEDYAFNPRNVATPTVTAYRRYLQENCQLRPTSVNRYLISLKRYFSWASQSALISRDPTKVVKMVGEDRQPPRHLEDREESSLLSAVENGGDVRDRTLIVLMLHTGLRASEVCRLSREDVVIRKRTGYLKVWGKGNRYREVPLNSTARDKLESYLRALDEQCLQAETLFPSNKTGEALTTRALGYIIRKYAEMAGIDKLSPHDLRHRFGYRMATQTPLHRLAQIMGHESLDTTLLYVQGTPQDLQQAVENIAWK